MVAPNTSSLQAELDIQKALQTEDAHMLVLLRDELYEGNWDDFVQDLQDRLSGKPHVFDLAPASPSLQETIRYHLALIQELRQLEVRENLNLADKLGVKTA